MRKPQKETRAKGPVWVARGVYCGRHPVTGKRVLRTFTGPTRESVETDIARARLAVSRGQPYLQHGRETVGDLCDSFEADGRPRWSPGTVLSVRTGLRPAREFFGRRKAGTLGHDDMISYQRYLATGARKTGGGLAPGSANKAMRQLWAVFDLAEKNKKIEANPCRWVRPLPGEHRERDSWDQSQLSRFVTAALAHRLSACMLLLALGLRLGEVSGLLWSDVSLSGGTITIARQRTLVGGQVIVRDPKSRWSSRTLPLFEPVSGALADMYRRQCGERGFCGRFWQGGDDWYLACNPQGREMRPDRLARQFRRLCGQAGIPVTGAHGTRIMANTLMELGGVPDTVRAGWLGHTVSVNRSHYLSPPDPAELARAAEAMHQLMSGGQVLQNSLQKTSPEGWNSR